MKKYLLTVTIELDCVDDIAVRDAANKVSKILSLPLLGKARLQEIFDNKPPRKVNWGYVKEADKETTHG